MDDATIGGAELDGSYVGVLRQVHGHHKAFIDVGAIGGDVHGFGQLNHEVGLAELPVAREDGRGGKVFGITLERTGRRPLLYGVNLKRRQTAFAREVVITGDRLPRRHESGAGDVGDEAGSLLYVVIRDERERGDLTFVVAGSAVAIEDGRDVSREDRPRGR